MPPPPPGPDGVRPALGALDTRRVGRTLLRFHSLSSTNDYAAALVDPGWDGAVVLADFQTGGRGQYGRVWQSRAGASVLLSAVVFPPPAACRAVVLTAWAAVAVADVVRTLAGADARVKWPNDVLVTGKKVCGTLIELAAGAGRPPRAVVGVGLNLNQMAAEFAAAGLPDAASLGMLGGRSFDPAAAAEAVIRELDAGYARLAAGDLAELEAAWAARLGVTGRAVSATLADGGAVAGQVRRVGFDAVVLDTADGVRTVAPERVRQLSPVAAL